MVVSIDVAVLLLSETVVVAVLMSAVGEVEASWKTVNTPEKKNSLDMCSVYAFTEGF